MRKQSDSADMDVMHNGVRKIRDLTKSSLMIGTNIFFAFIYARQLGKIQRSVTTHTVEFEKFKTPINDNDRQPIKFDKISHQTLKAQTKKKGFNRDNLGLTSI